MRLAVGTVIRSGTGSTTGRLLTADLDGGSVEVRADSLPAQRDVPEDRNPRGGARGWRGIVHADGVLVAATYHSLHVLDGDLGVARTIRSPLLAGVHELWAPGDGTVWATSTVLDAAICLRLDDGAVVDERWPRNQPGIADALDLDPQEVDRTVDHGLTPVEAADRASHLHLNAVTGIDGRLHALANHLGAVLDLDEERVVLHDPTLRGSHNLVPLRDGTVGVVVTAARELRRYDPASGWREVQRIDLRGGAARRVWWEARLRERTWSPGRRLGRVRRGAPRPFFARGLVQTADEEVVVGTSPAAVLRVDLRRGVPVQALRLGGDDRHCVHGLTVLDPADRVGR